MIINLICGDNIFTCNDKQWEKIRCIISSASYQYIMDYKNNLLINDFTLSNENVEENNEENNENIMEKEYKYYNKTLYEKTVNKEDLLLNIENFISEINFFNNPLKQSKNTDPFLNLYKKYLNLLTILGLSGIYSLNNTDLYNSFYSIGNSYDIANAIDLIMPFINNEYIEHLIFEILLIFNHSVKNNLVVSITNINEFEILENDFSKNKQSLINIIHKKGSLSSLLKCKK